MKSQFITVGCNVGHHPASDSARDELTEVHKER